MICQADEDLAQLLNLVALRSVEAFDRGQPGESRAETEVKFAAIPNQMPFGFGSMDDASQCIVVNAAMRCFVPEQIPSRDLRHIWQWRAFDAEGHPLGRRRRPGARALRDDTVCPGIICDVSE